MAKVDAMGLLRSLAFPTVRTTTTPDPHSHSLPTSTTWNPHDSPADVASAESDANRQCSLKLWVRNLPSIYLRLLTALHAVKPCRRPGQEVGLLRISRALDKEGFPWTFQQLMLASESLEKQGIVEIRVGRIIRTAVYLCPTALGERIITLLPGSRSVSVWIPRLPPLPAPAPPPPPPPAK